MIKTSSKIPDSFRSTNAKTTDDQKARILVNIDGMPKTGKSHFAFSAAALGPLGNLNVDMRQEGVRGKFIGKSEYHPIGTVDIKIPVISAKQELYKKVWQQAQQTYNAFIADPEVRAVMIDTSSDFYELSRLAAFGKLLQVKPMHYSQVNMAFKSLIRKAYQSNKHLLLLNTLKKHYEGDPGSDDAMARKWDGKTYERMGFSGSGYAAQLSVQTLKEMVTVMKDGKPVMVERNGERVKKKRPKFGIEITECGLDPRLEGERLWGEDCNFPNLCRMVLGDLFKE